MVGADTTVHDSGDDEIAGSAGYSFVLLDRVARFADEDDDAFEDDAALLDIVRGDTSIAAESTRLLRMSSLKHERKML